MKRIGYPASLAAALLIFAGCATPTNPPAVAPAAAPASPAPADTGGTKADLAEARRLSRENQHAAAQARFLRYLAQHPEDADARFWYGFDLQRQADTTADASAARALRRQAREQILQAQKLGCTEPLLETLLATLKPDGTPPPVSQHSAIKQVDALMQAAEKAYNAGNFSEAAKLHQQAFALEPTNYQAALWCGDAYFGQKDYATAGTWFAKAVAINPDIETAHRYWGDALAHLGRRDDALTQYIEAVVADPFNRLTRTRFNDIAKVMLVPLRTEPLRLPPGQFTLKDGKPEIHMDPSAGECGNVLGLAYAVACANVRVEQFATRFPQEKQPRRTLVEEVEGLRTMLSVYEGMTEEKSPKITADDLAKWGPALKILAAIDHDGLLEPFALLERADPELAKDYAPYRAAHRDKLIRFVRVYWCSRE
ncbi:MAG TPA: tetratricopeptide repeat protein [Opitutaceae bacterium]|nr:tetratricopeptide repeat protein [Opitutaceae bacterium]